MGWFPGIMACWLSYNDRPVLAAIWFVAAMVGWASRDIIKAIRESRP